MTYFIANKNSVLVTHNNETHTIDSSFPQFEAIVSLLQDGKADEAVVLIDTGKAIVEFGGGNFTVSQGVVKFGDHEVDNSLTKRIIQMMGEGENCDPMINFLNNLMDNPSYRSVQETYSFLEQNDLPITPDGYFIAYKNVNEEYMDKHTGTFSNRVGDTCEMPRFKVDDDRNRTCSAGLHFCSLEYLRGFWGTSGHTMLVKVNPRDVVSIPTDYNNSKGRTCKYEVVAEVKFKDGEVNEILDASVWKPELPVKKVKEKTTNELLQELITLQTK